MLNSSISKKIYVAIRIYLFIIAKGTTLSTSLYLVYSMFEAKYVTICSQLYLLLAYVDWPFNYNKSGFIRVDICLT